MIWTDRSMYEGEWIGGIQHGLGRMIFPDGTQKEGYFENNVFKYAIGDISGKPQGELSTNGTYTSGSSIHNGKQTPNKSQISAQQHHMRSTKASSGFQSDAINNNLNQNQNPYLINNPHWHTTQ